MYVYNYYQGLSALAVGSGSDRDKSRPHYTCFFPGKIGSRSARSTFAGSFDLDKVRSEFF